MSTQQLALLEQLMRKECRNIKLTETEWGIDNDPTSLTQSKVLGAGFFPAYLEEEYPRNKQGVPFVMLVQINFAAVAPMEGTQCNPSDDSYWPSHASDCSQTGEHEMSRND